MAESDQRVACPACQSRFRVPIARVPAGSSLSARCRACATQFEVVNVDGELMARGLEIDAAEPPLPDGFDVGDRLGRYEIEGLAGRGGMGAVYRAFDPSANRHIAVKVLRRDATALDRTRFEREILVQANIRHPHIMPIFDSGTDGTTRFYTMELLHDPLDLTALAEMVQFRRVDDERLKDLVSLYGVIEHVVMPMCKAVQHANAEEGVLHRDIKPVNVMVDRRTLRPYLIDFGVSSLLEPINPRMKHVDENYPMPLKGKGVHVTGTLMFMPPEQAKGLADPRGDVWALGSLLHYLVTGAAPFEEAIRPVISRTARIQNIRLLLDEARKSANDEEVREYSDMLQAIETGQERTAADLRRDVLRGRYLPRPPGLDPRLDFLIGKAMHSQVSKRFGNAALLHDALEDWLAERDSTPGAASDRSDHLPVPAGSWKRPAVLGALGGLVLGAGAVALWPKAPPPDTAAVVAAHLSRAKDAQEPQGQRRAVLDAVHDGLGPKEGGELLDLIRKGEHEAFSRGRARQLEQRARSDDLSTRARDRLLGAVQERRGFHDGDDFRKDQHRLTWQVQLEGLPAGGKGSIYPLTSQGVDWTHPTGSEQCEPGPFVVELTRGTGSLYVPTTVLEGRNTVVQCPIDPARVPPGMVYVPGGTFRTPDGSTVAVAPSLWETHEVTADRYAAFLRTLSLTDRRERVPRLAGSLGEAGAPTWDQEDDEFTAPVDARRKPVEGVSLHDAQAFAAFAKRRLPTEAEWMWAAQGPFAAATPLGTLDGLSDRAHIARPLAGATGTGETATDRNLFGIYDLAGNVAEFTATMTRDGWVTKGGGYDRAPVDAVIAARQIVLGWVPQQGVGIRLVADLSALLPETPTEPK